MSACHHCNKPLEPNEYQVVTKYGHFCSWVTCYRPWAEGIADQNERLKVESVNHIAGLACRDLPNRWVISISLEFGAGSVTLHHNEVEHELCPDITIAEQVMEAIEFSQGATDD